MHTKQNIPQWLGVLLFLLVLMSLAGCGEDSITAPLITDKETHEETSVQDLDLTDVSRVDAVTINGSITVRGQESTASRLEIHTKVSASTLEEAQSITATIQVDVEVIEGELVIRSSYPDPPSGVEVVVDYDLPCLETIPLDLEAANGTISADDMKGSVEASIANGRVAIAPSVGSTGPIRGVVANGVVAVDLDDDSRYYLTARATNGCIRGVFDGVAIDACGQFRDYTAGSSEGIPCELRVVSGLVEINLP